MSQDKETQDKQILDNQKQSLAFDIFVHSDDMKLVGEFVRAESNSYYSTKNLARVSSAEVPIEGMGVLIDAFIMSETLKQQTNPEDKETLNAKAIEDLKHYRSELDRNSEYIRKEKNLNDDIEFAKDTVKILKARGTAYVVYANNEHQHQNLVKYTLENGVIKRSFLNTGGRGKEDVLELKTGNTENKEAFEKIKSIHNKELASEIGPVGPIGMKYLIGSEKEAEKAILQDVINSNFSSGGGARSAEKGGGNLQNLPIIGPASDKIVTTQSRRTCTVSSLMHGLRDLENKEGFNEHDFRRLHNFIANINPDEFQKLLNLPVPDHRHYKDKNPIVSLHNRSRLRYMPPSPSRQPSSSFVTAKSELEAKEVLNAIKEDNIEKLTEILSNIKPTYREQVVYKTLQQVREVKNINVLNKLIDASPAGTEKYIEYIQNSNDPEAAETKRLQENQAKADNEPTSVAQVKTGELNIPKYVEEYHKKMHSTQKINETIGIKPAEEIAGDISKDITAFAEKYKGKKVSENGVKKFFEDNLNKLETNGNITTSEKLEMVNNKNFEQEVKNTTNFLNLDIPKISLGEKLVVKFAGLLRKLNVNTDIVKNIEAKVEEKHVGRIKKIESQLVNVIKAGNVFKTNRLKNKLEQAGVQENIKSKIKSNTSQSRQQG